MNRNTITRKMVGWIFILWNQVRGPCCRQSCHVSTSTSSVFWLETGFQQTDKANDHPKFSHPFINFNPKGHLIWTRDIHESVRAATNNYLFCFILFFYIYFSECSIILFKQRTCLQQCVFYVSAPSLRTKTVYLIYLYIPLVSNVRKWKDI